LGVLPQPVGQPAAEVGQVAAVLDEACGLQAPLDPLRFEVLLGPYGQLAAHAPSPWVATSFRDLHTNVREYAILHYAMQHRGVYARMVGERGGMAMGLGRVQARGQVTIPAEVRGALRIRPGDVLLFEATGPDEGRFRVVRTTRSLDEYFDRWRVDGPVPADL